MIDLHKTNFYGSFSVSFPLSDIDPTAIGWKSVEIHQEIERHDLAVMEARAHTPQYLETLAPGSPVVITYANVRQTPINFVGYVVEVHPLATLDKEEGSIYRRKIVAVAASREFRNTANNTWRNRTGPEIVSEIGRQLGFRVITKNHPLRRKHVVQGGDTYWEVLTKLAKMTGYVLRAEGTTLYFLPLADMVAAFTSLSGRMTTTMADGYRPTAIEIDVAVGNTSDDGDDLSDAAVVVALGPNDKIPTAAREVPDSVIRARRATSSTYNKYSPSVVAHSRADAKALAKGMADRGSMAFDGHAAGWGDNMLAPYHPVYIDNGDPASSGYWIVKKATHRMIQGKYASEIVMSTDEVSPQRAAPPQDAYRDVEQELVQGWSPMTGMTSRLKILSPSFVSGATFRRDSQVAQWVTV